MRRIIPALAALCAIAPPAWAQATDGTWRGRMTCPAHQQMRANDSPFQLQVAGGQIRYERVINSNDGQPTANVEAGRGTISADGAVIVNGRGRSGPTSELATSFRGRVAGAAMTLEGEQRWTVNGRALPPRPCTIRVSRG